MYCSQKLFKYCTYFSVQSITNNVLNVHTSKRWLTVVLGGICFSENT